MAGCFLLGSRIVKDCSGEENYNLSVPVGGILGGGPDFPVRADF